MEHYSGENGISHGTVTSILKDREGFLWLGTWNGLNRFDGKYFKSYRSLSSSSYLESQRIIQIEEGNNNVLWIRTYDRNVYSFDKKTERFTSVSNLFQKRFGKKILVDKIFTVNDEYIWFTSTSGMYGLRQDDLSQNGLVEVHDVVNGNTNLGRVNFVFKDDTGSIWVGTDKGLSTFLTKTTARDKCHIKALKETVGLDITRILEDKHQVYFSTVEGFLIMYNKRSQKLKRIQVGQSSINYILLSSDKKWIYLSSDNGDLYKYDIYEEELSLLTNFDQSIGSIYEDRRGNIWLEPSLGGAILWNRETDNKTTFRSKSKRSETNVLFHCYEDKNNTVWVSLKGGGFGYYDEGINTLHFQNRNDVGSLTVFPQQLYTSLFDDDVLWLCTEEKGLIKIIIQENNVEKDNLSDILENGDPEVRSLLHDSKGRLWVGTKGGKLFLKRHKQYEQAPIDNLDKIDLSGVYSLLEDNQGYIWIGTKSNGIYLAVPKNAESKSYKLLHYNKSNSDLESNQIYSILEDENNEIWLGTFGRGLVKTTRDKEKVRFKTVPIGDGHHPAGSFDKVRDLELDDLGNIWIATTYGLVVYDKNKRQTTFRDTYQNTNNLGANDIQYLIKTRKGDMWICTSGGGVSRAVGRPFEGLSFQNFNMRNGIGNDYVLSGIEDSDGNLWFATEGGISKYVASNGSFFTFDSFYGQSGFSFSEKTVAMTSVGNIIWGTSKGIMTTPSNVLAKDRRKANLVFSSLLVNNKEITSYSVAPLLNVQYTDALVLDYDQKNLSIDFTIVDYKHHKHNYLYRLVGLDSNWYSNQQLNRVTFTNLKPGRYLFEVKGHTDLYEETPYKSLKIIISPPWWKSWWAYCLYILLLIVAIIICRKIFLKMFELKHTLEVEKRITSMKMTFFTNISHELRTPLTLILSPISKLLNDKTLSRENTKYVSMVHRNAVRMESFVNQLLDLRKIQENKFRINFEPVDIVDLAKNVIQSFQLLAKDRGVYITTFFVSDSFVIHADKIHVETILYNVISNAIKFSPDHEEVVVSMTQDGDSFVIEILDRGTGVKEEALQQIFELFYVVPSKLSEGVKGSGIGLALTKELVDMHSGTICAFNNEEKGLTVQIMLPIYQIDKKQDVAFFEKVDENKKVEDFVTATNDLSSHKPVVLVVEDNDDLNSFLQMQLEVYYTVLTAPDGEVGLEKAKKYSPDLIVSDIMMPNMDGVSMLSEIRKTNHISHTPVVLLTAKHAIESQIEGLQYGADYYITKPFHVDFLLTSISNLLQRRSRFFNQIVDKRDDLLKPSDLVITDLDEQFLKNVVRIVEEKMVDPDFHIELVSESLNMSRNTFYKKFKSLTNLTPVEFVRDIRLQRAKQLLETGMDNVAEVAYAVGFSNPKYFSTCFKVKYNISPKEFYQNSR